MQTEVIRRQTRVIDTAIGDWTYGIDAASTPDGARLYVVSWAGAEPVWNDDGVLVCPVGPGVAGDETGAIVFDDLDDARDYYEDMIAD